MKLLVAVKRVPDPYGRIRLTEGGRLDTSEARGVVNPYDEIALDVAHALRQSGAAAESVAVSAAPARDADAWGETLRAALARGADRALLLTYDGEGDRAAALADAVRREDAALVLCGRQGADTDDGQTGGRLAGLLGWPLLAAAQTVSVENGCVRITRETDAGRETVESPLPAVVTCDLRGRDPRPLPLPAILKAKNKPLETVPLPPVTRQEPPRAASYALPTPRAACRFVRDLDELLAALGAAQSGGGGAPAEQSTVALPDDERIVVGSPAEADALVWVAGRRGWPLVPNVESASLQGDTLRVTHRVYAGRFLRTLDLPLANTPLVLIAPEALRTDAHRARVSALLADERPQLGERVSLDAPDAARPDLGAARVVVAGGRVLRDAETFERLVGGLADALGGAAAASGGAVNAGIAPSWMLIGQTGRSVAPDLYVALGISGSDQHVAGFQGAKTVVAINTDAEAPIFRVADLGLVADLHKVVPAWIQKAR